MLRCHRASLVISRDKAETWQANYKNLFPCSNSCAVFNLLNTVASKKGSSRDPEFPNSKSPLPTSTTPISAHTSLSKFPPLMVLSIGFMNNLCSVQCSDLSDTPQHFLLPFTTKELTTAISKLSTSTASGPDLIVYPLLTHFLLQLSNISPSSTGPGLSTPFPFTGNLQPLSPYTNPVNLPTLQPHIVQFLPPPVYPNFLSAWVSIASATT